MSTNNTEIPVNDVLEHEPQATEVIVNEALEQRMKRIDKAHICFKSYTIGSVAVGFIPMPFVDIAALAAIQLKMVHSIATIYDVPFSKNLTTSIIGSILGGSIAVALAWPVARLAKLIPVVGQASGIIGTAVTGAASTYAVGKIFVEHFESGGTFLDFNEEKAKAHFKELYEEGKAFIAAQKTAAA